MRTKGMMCVGTLAVSLALTLGCRAARPQSMVAGTAIESVSVAVWSPGAGVSESAASHLPACNWEDWDRSICTAFYSTVCNHPACYDCKTTGRCVPHECWCVLGDLNCDGIVDLADFAVFQNALGGPSE